MLWHRQLFSSGKACKIYCFWTTAAMAAPNTKVCKCCSLCSYFDPVFHRLQKKRTITCCCDDEEKVLENGALVSSVQSNCVTTWKSSQNRLCLLRWRKKQMHGYIVSISYCVKLITLSMLLQPQRSGPTQIQKSETLSVAVTVTVTVEHKLVESILKVNPKPLKKNVAAPATDCLLLETLWTLSSQTVASPIIFLHAFQLSSQSLSGKNVARFECSKEYAGWAGSQQGSDEVRCCREARDQGCNWRACWFSKATSKFLNLSLKGN